ncbi:T9SS type A sorting domain-containing protein [bacterium SCSIO 12741]|nr:T9SS type A sorting domain-containing protein [bacterium SCSIO 12741]
MIKNIGLLVVSFIAAGALHAQEMIGKSGSQASDFTQYQEQWAAWKDKAGENTKGSKWLERWLHFNESRTTGQGALAPNSYFLDAAIQNARIQNHSSASRASDSTWIPEGPDTLVFSYNNASSHGVARVNCIAFHPTDTFTYFVGVAQGGIWKTTNSGKSYTPMNNGLPVIRINDIAIDPNNPEIMYASIGDYAYMSVALQTDGRKRNTHYGLGVYKSTDGGKSWNPTGLSYQLTDLDQSLVRRVLINPANSQELVAVGVAGTWKSYDGGANWTAINNEMMWDLESNPDRPQTLIASSGYVLNLGIGRAAIWLSHDFGDTWTQASAPIPPTDSIQRMEVLFARADTTRVYALACGVDRGLYGFYESRDGGRTWNRKMMAASGPNLLHWGEGTSSGGQGTYDLALITDANDPDKVFTGGINVWGSDDGGATWDGASYWLRYYGFTPHADQHQFKYNPLDEKYYLCNDGGIFRTDTLMIGSWRATDTVPGYQFPTQWEDVSSGMQITSFYRLGLSKNNPGYIVTGAQDNGTFYRDSAGTWINISGGDGMECIIDPDDPEIVYTSSQYGNFYRTRNGGRTSNYWGNGISENGAWTTPFVQHPDDPDIFYSGFVNLYKVENNFGSRINTPGSGEYINALHISGKHPEHLALTRRINYQNFNNSELWVTEDEGNNWQNRTAGLPDSLYLTYLFMDDRDPDKMWVSVGGFAPGVKVFETSDGGKNWTNISQNLPNIPVNCVIEDVESRDNALYVATDVGIYYTNDSINGWNLYSKNLPNVIVSELEIQPKERRIYCTTFGRGVWSAELLDSAFVFPQDTATDTTDTLNTVVNQNWYQSQFELYPNPNNGQFTIRASVLEATRVEWRLIDVMGKTIYRKPQELQPGMQEWDLNMNLLPGLYYVHFSNGQRSKALQFVVE